MDIDIKFWLAMLALYLLQFFLGKKKKPVTTSEHLPDLQKIPSDNSGSNEFHDALAEISTMLGGAPAEPRPSLSSRGSSPTATKVPSTPVKTGLTRTSVARSEMSKKAELLPPGQPFFDEAFDQKEYVSFHRPEIHHVGSLKSNLLVKQKKTPLSQMIRTDLKDRSKIREAIVLAEVLGPPVSRPLQKR
jgi:hypothetical protein